jgi:hypothetical protein
MIESLRGRVHACLGRAPACASCGGKHGSAEENRPAEEGQLKGSVLGLPLLRLSLPLLPPASSCSFPRPPVGVGLALAGRGGA